MLFNSYEFIFVFLPIMFFGYFFLTSYRLIVGSKIWLVGGSLFFYSWWNPVYLPLILASIFVNYAIGTRLGSSFNPANAKERVELHVSRKVLLFTGVTLNLTLLAYFKYTDFLIYNFNGIFDTEIQLQNIILPLAISFFTFQQVAYLVDSYRGETKEYNLLNYMLFITFFPQLIAGPIVHHSEMMPQFSSQTNLVRRYRNIALGLFVFSVGLFKKVVIADTFSQWANAGFDEAITLNLLEAWVVSLSYTFQLYFDFSGYVDMATGAALLFNIKLPINFNSPYKATSIQDFWRRWHITLSRFLRDYIYIPLGGSREGELRTYINLFATFIIGGIWHGASWMFVIWGALHGIALIINHVWKKTGIKLWKWIAWLITFNFVNVTWVFFRSNELDDAYKVLKAMFNLNNIVLPSALSEKLASLSIYGVEFGGLLVNIQANIKEVAPFMLLGMVLSLLFKNTVEKSRNFTPSYKNLSITLIAMIISTYAMLTIKSEFLYFNF